MKVHTKKYKRGALAAGWLSVVWGCTSWVADSKSGVMSDDITVSHTSEIALERGTNS